MKKEPPKLYERLPNGRYKEWKEPERPKYDNALYRRVGKKYEPVHMLFNDGHFWQEGVFVVTKNIGALQPDSWTSVEYLQEIFKLYRCGDLENVSIAKLGGMKKLTDHLLHHWDEIGGASTFEIAASIVAILMNYENRK